MAGYPPRIGSGAPAAAPSGVFHRLGELVARYHWQVIALWLAALVAAVPLTSALLTFR